MIMSNQQNNGILCMLKTINEYIKKALFEKETTETEQIYLKFNGFWDAF